MSDSVSITYTFPQGEYYIIPSTYMRKTKGSYVLYIYSTDIKSIKLTQLSLNYSQQDTDKMNTSINNIIYLNRC